MSYKRGPEMVPQMLNERVCRICGKVYIKAPYHIYKDDKGCSVCSWGCSLEAERRAEARYAEKAAKRAAARRKPSQAEMRRHEAEQRRQIRRERISLRDSEMRRLFAEGVSAEEIAERMNLSYSHTWKILRSEA